MAMKILFSALSIGVYFSSSVQADSFFFPNTTGLGPRSNTVSAACEAAIKAPLDCDGGLITVIQTDFYGPIGNTTLQDSLCRATCGSQLAAYRSSVATACSKDPQPWPGLPAPYYGELAQAAWNLTCLEDAKTGEYCTDYVGTAFKDLTGDTKGSDLPTAKLCSDCVIKILRQIQSTPYSNFDSNIASQLSAIQSKCQITLPSAVPTLKTNVTHLPGYALPGSGGSGECLSGNTYTVVSGDNCQVIAEKEKVGTGALIVVNNILPDCSNLWLGASICLPETCVTYKVQSGDTCAAIAAARGMSYVQLLAWNPSINSYCTNLIAGHNLCVGPPGGATWTGTPIPGATGTQTAIYATATVPAPNPVASGTTRRCGKYYQVQSGDYCQLVSLNQTISLDLFTAINPSIDKTCSNLLSGFYYCVFPTANWNGTTVSTTVSAPAPTPTGTTEECYEWHIVESGNYCGLLMNQYGITFAQLQYWNPHLSDDCGNLMLGVAYCVNGVVQPPEAQPTGATTIGVERVIKRQQTVSGPVETGAVVRGGEPVAGGGVPTGYPYPLWGRGGALGAKQEL